MGAKRWQLWVITMFILTGIIGVFQLFEGPKSVGAVTVAGGAANPALGLPERSLQATELPAWQPSAAGSQSTVARTTTTAQRPIGVTTQAAGTQSTTKVTVVSTQSPTTSSPVVSVKSVPSTAGVSSTATTTQPKATTTTPKAVTTTAKATTTAPQPSQSVLKPTAPASSAQPTCSQFFIFWVCR
jgi:hypothetical protein